MADLILAVGWVAAGLLLGWWLGSRRRPGPGRGIESEAPSALRPKEAVSPPAQDQPSTGQAQIRQALDDLRLGVIVLDAGGEEIYRNRAAGRYATRRHGNAIVDAALERVVQGAMIGRSLEEAVELYGPPAESLLVQASPTGDGDSVGGVVAVIEDITEARHLDRVRRDFVANVSHELRTPVGAMIVLVDALSDSDDPEVIQRLTDGLQQEADRLAQTIDDLLVLSRLESGPIEVRETTDLASIARMAVERVTEAATARAITVAVNRTFDGPILVDCDPGQLVSAVANLLENAIKYSDGGATVTLRLSIHDGTVHTGSAPSGGTHEPLGVLSVIDSGIGIPERDLARIFERFYRVDTARSRETGGTGLGLSIVRHAVMNHGGTVSVDSIEGRGSTFTIHLPISPAHPPTDRFEADELLPAGNGTSMSGDEGTMH
jgi:two-component system sensor histidine kinase SenX3